MRIANIAVILTFFFLSCHSPVPKNVLSEEKMVAIIADLQLADAAYKLAMLPDNYHAQPEKYFLEILANHQVDSATYHRSMRYYAQDPGKLNKIYLKVEKSIQQSSNQR